MREGERRGHSGEQPTCHRLAQPGLLGDVADRMRHGGAGNGDDHAIVAKPAIKFVYLTTILPHIPPGVGAPTPCWVQ